MDIISAMMGAGAGAGAGDGWARGGANLGAIMGGGEGKVYDAALERQHTLAEKLAKARIARDEALAREELTTSLEGVTKDPAAARALSSVLRGDFGNFEQGTAGLGNLIENEAKRGALDAAMRGDVDAANRLVSVSSGKPLQVRDIEGGVEYAPYQQAGVPTAVTPVGAAQVMRDQTQATANTARAGASDAMTGRTNANVENDRIRRNAAVAQAAEKLIAQIQKESKTTLDEGQRAAIYAHVADGSPVDIRIPANKAAEAMQGAGSIAPAPPASAGRNTGVSPGADRVDGEPAITRDEGLRLLKEGRDAIARGADRAQVAQRLRSMGYPNLAGRL